jgi:hypothetical protein
MQFIREMSLNEENAEFYKGRNCADTESTLQRFVDKNKNKTPWPESASELYRPRDRRLSPKLVQGNYIIATAQFYVF